MTLDCSQCPVKPYIRVELEQQAKEKQDLRFSNTLYKGYQLNIFLCINVLGSCHKTQRKANQHNYLVCPSPSTTQLYHKPAKDMKATDCLHKEQQLCWEQQIMELRVKIEPFSQLITEAILTANSKRS